MLILANREAEYFFQTTGQDFAPHARRANHRLRRSSLSSRRLERRAGCRRAIRMYKEYPTDSVSFWRKAEVRQRPRSAKCQTRTHALQQQPHHSDRHKKSRGIERSPLDTPDRGSSSARPNVRLDSASDHPDCEPSGSVSTYRKKVQPLRAARRFARSSAT